MRICILFLFSFLIQFTLTADIHAQLNLREKRIIVSKNEIIIDTLSILPSSFQMTICQNKLDTSYFDIDAFSSKLNLNYSKIKSAFPNCDTLILTYQPLPFQPNKIYSNKSNENKIPDPKNNSFFSYKPSQLKPDYFLTEGLNKTGSISRGVNFGNNQDLSVNSSLNLELSGKISDEVSILGSITDNNIPIQPDGNTQQLQDFDQIFIKVFDKNNSLTAGDFWMKKPTGYFMNYNKRAQGASYSRLIKPTVGSNDYQFSLTTGIAVSKGKFSRNVFMGLEGNQGPYRLKGAENEQFIIILAGTETVYIDGQLLTRGQENDYIIDYNTSEITFTANQFITKDRRIIVEFQYSDKNYARSILYGSTEWKNEKNKIYLNVYSEQDAKNQPLQQTLNTNQKDLLANVGDSIHLAVSESIEQVDFSTSLVLYKKVDSLGYDSVFVFSIHPDSAHYRLGFSLVGNGNGDYVQSSFTALGKTYKWVAPDTIGVTIIHNGNYAPVTLLVSPKQRQMVTAGMEHQFTKQTKIGTELSYTKYDLNTFSKINDSDDGGYAGKFFANHEINLQKENKKDPLLLKAGINFETVSNNFQQIERFRSVEFERNWNILNTKVKGDQYNGDAKISLSQKKWGKTEYVFNTFVAGNNYTGFMHESNSQIKYKGFSALVNGSLLSSEGIYNSSFLRHNSTISQSIKNFKITFKDIHEWNKYFNASRDTLANSSYRFYDYEISLGTNDSSINKYNLFYRKRYDWGINSNEFSNYALANQYGASMELLKNRKNQIRAKLSYRELLIKDSTLTVQKPDETILGRLEYDLKALKNSITSNTFYEIGTGQELLREFIYIEVPAGQGNYTWNDYNGNNIKELNEFEIATFTDQATYIRTFIPTSNYTRTYTNQFSQSINLQPSQIWSKKKGILKFLSRFSNQTAYRIERKTNGNDKSSAYNPLLKEIADTTLLSLNTSLRNSFFFNRTSPIFGMDYTFLDNRGKVLLSNGFDSRIQTYHQLNLRWNITKSILFQSKCEQGEKGNASDFLSGRNFLIAYFNIAPKISFQPNTNFRASIQYEYTDKKNEIDYGGETAFINDIGTEIKYNVTEKGSLLANFNFINIKYNGNANSSLGFEMLNALKPGKNYTWSFSFQRTINKNMQLNILYTGRKNEDNKIIHNGGVQVRAFF